MKELRSEVKTLLVNELERANGKFPMFRSDHEGISVIREELHEAAADMESLKHIVDQLETAVFCDMTTGQKESIAYDAEREAIELACEAIQTAAMLLKFRDSHLPEDNLSNEPFSQEEADMLAESCPEADPLALDFDDFSRFMELLITRKQRVEEGMKNA